MTGGFSCYYDFIMKKADAETFIKDSKTRYFSLLNYPELKIEASSKSTGEYITALSEISSKDTQTIANIIKQSSNEVELAHNLTGIK